MDLSNVYRPALPLLLALTGVAAVGLLRGFGSLSRLRLWAGLTGLFGGTMLAVSGTGIPYEDVIVRSLFALTILLATASVLRFIDLVFWDWFLSRRRHLPVPRLAIDLFKLLTMVGVMLAVLKFDFGMELSGLLVTSTVVSAVIGLAIQDMLANVASGLALQMERPFKVGDWLLIGSHEGVVTQLNWRTLTLLTRDRHEILVPNSMVAKTEVINFCRPSTLQRAHTYVGVAYGHPPGVVKAALARAASSCPEVLAEPPVEILVKSFDESAIQYDVRYWINDFGRLLQILDDVNSRVWYELQRQNLTIAFPQRDVTVRTASDEQETQAAERRRSEIFSVLRPLPVFAPLSDDQIRTLVGGAALQRFMDGETLVEQGDSGDSLFVIRSGGVRIDKSVHGGPAATIATMGAGEFFGEMSLLTGEPRTASIVAGEETQVVVVSKESFAPVLAADKGILPGLTDVLDARVRHTAEHVADRGAAQLQATGAAQERPALLRKIGRFFGLDEN